MATSLSHPTHAAKSGCCPLCGTQPDADGEPIIKRGAVTVALDPVIVRWRDRYVPLSRIEASLFAVIARRGRMLHSEIDEALTTIGASPATKSLVLGHIRGKMAKVGACDPFERIGRDAIRLRVDADENGNTGMVIGAKESRYVRVTTRASTQPQ